MGSPAVEGLHLSGRGRFGLSPRQLNFRSYCKERCRAAAIISSNCTKGDRHITVSFWNVIKTIHVYQYVHVHVHTHNAEVSRS